MGSVDRKLRIVNDFIDEAGIPVDVTSLARLLGIRVYVAPWPDNISGKIQRDEKRGGSSGFAIFVNQSHPRTRRRFTISHEIAHYVLHEHKIGDGVFDDALYRSGLPSSFEAEANRLAADILMPWKYLNDAIDKYGPNVDGLARLFDVSRSAMSIRLGVPYE